MKAQPLQSLERLEVGKLPNFVQAGIRRPGYQDIKQQVLFLLISDTLML
jgi:hypothetical protein